MQWQRRARMEMWSTIGHVRPVRSILAGRGGRTDRAPAAGRAAEGEITVNSKEYRQVCDEAGLNKNTSEKVPACSCGWTGKVDWKAHGQKCPKCGEILT